MDSCPCFCLLGPHIPAVKFFVDLRHHPYATTVFLAAKPCGGIGFRLAHHRPGNSSSAYFLWRRLQENERRCSCRGARGSPRWPESCFIRITTTFPRWLRFRPQPSCAVCSATTVIMAAKPAASFADIRGRFGSRHAHQRLGCSSSAYFLWCGLQEKLQRCSCCGLLAGLALLHPHHHDLTRLVAALTFAQQRTRGRSRPSTCPVQRLRGPPSGQSGAPRIRPPRRRDCHLRRRALAAGAAGPAPPLRARGRSCTSAGSTPCSCGLSTVQGL